MPSRPAFRHWKWLLAFTLIEISVPWVLFGHAETRLNSSTAGLLIAVVPLFAAVIVTRLGHERLEPRRMLGLGLGFAGVALLVGLDIHFADLLGRRRPPSSWRSATRSAPSSSIAS